MKSKMSKIAFGAVMALALTAFAAAQEPVSYSWGNPAPAAQTNPTPQPVATGNDGSHSYASATPALASDYRGNPRDVLGTINDVVYGPSHTGRTIAIIGGSAAGGAVLGGITYGKKGAVIGAIGGGLAGWAIDRATRHKTIFGY
jgi:uncharacterized protein YcfJ